MAIQGGLVTKFGFLLVSLLFLIGCTSNHRIDEVDWIKSNLTSFEFSYNDIELNSKLKSIFSVRNQVKNKIPVGAGDAYGVHAVDTIETANSHIHKAILNSPENQLDIILNNMGNLWKSDYYSVKNERAQTMGSFHIHLELINKSKSLVSVNVIALKVINGVECCGPHGRYSRYTEVEPTTVEEYAILKYIGVALGIEMPSISRPENG